MGLRLGLIKNALTFGVVVDVLANVEGVGWEFG